MATVFCVTGPAADVASTGTAAAFILKNAAERCVVPAALAVCTMLDALR
jgi:arginine exporter protein ArgO